MEKLMSENAVEILFQRTAVVTKIEVERKEVRDEHYKITGHKEVRTVTLTLLGTASYNKTLEFEHPSLEMGREVRFVVTNQPALTEEQIAPSKVTEIS